MLKFVAILCILFSISNKAIVSQLFHPRCPQYIPKTEFAIEQFLGKWYEVEKNQFFADTIKCIATTFTKTATGKIRVVNEGTNRISGVQRIIRGKLVFSDKGPNKKTNLAKLNIQYNSPLNIPFPTFPFNYALTYTILDTDYRNYAVAWNCNSFELMQNVWILTRERNPSNAVLQEAYGVLDKYNINRSSFAKTVQEDCDDEDETIDAEEQDDAAKSTTETLVQAVLQQ